MALKLFLVAAARPNFMKVAPIWRALQQYPEAFDPHLIHTGQHYDSNMSEIFFADLGLPQPHFHLGVGSGTHAEQTAGVMMAFEKICVQEKPDLVLVVGDVNATMAATITAAKLWIDVGHVEAGLRSRDRLMPEEINRLATDALADLLFTPSADADENLLQEGVPREKIILVGNIMIDSLVHARTRVADRAKYAEYGLKANDYGLVTLHRPSNVDDPASLGQLCECLVELRFPLIFPVHPRTRKVMAKHKLDDLLTGEDSQVIVTEPLGYDDFLNLEMNARLLVTDSGGIQEETTYLGIPCLTLRTTTERPITVELGTNELVTLANLPQKMKMVLDGRWKSGTVPPLWDGRTGERIVDALRQRYDL